MLTLWKIPSFYLVGKDARVLNSTWDNYGLHIVEFVEHDRGAKVLHDDLFLYPWTQSNTTTQTPSEPPLAFDVLVLSCHLYH